MHNGTLVIKSNFVKRVEPGVNGKAKKRIDIPHSRAFIEAGTNLIIQHLNPDRTDEIPRYALTSYHVSDGIVSVENTSRIEIEFPNPEEFLDFKEFYYHSKRSLFPRRSSPSLNEISQTALPNCSFLAAVQSILNHPHGAAFIRGMMKQGKDGRTIVRLYNSDTLQPEYISVDTAILSNNAGPLNDHQALWVYVLETAVLGLERRYNSHSSRVTSSVAATASFTGVFGNGSQTTWTLLVLTGLIQDYKKNIVIPSLHQPTIAELSQCYSNIEKGLQDGQLVTCVSQNRELMPGVVGRHAYTVTAVFKKEEKPLWGGETKVVPYIRLRNPWGSKQWWNGGIFETVSEVNYGTFEIKLEDFYKYFDLLTFSNPATKLFALDDKRLKILESLETNLSSFVVTQATPLQNLSHLKAIYKDYEEKVLKLEYLYLSRFLVEGIHEYIITTYFNARFQDQIFSNEAAHKEMVFEALKKLRTSPFNDHEFNQFYNLFKLEFIEKPTDARQSPEQDRAKQELQTDIVQNAGYDFCDAMKLEKHKLDILVQRYEAMYENGMNSYQRDAASILEQISHGITAENESDIFTKCLALQEKMESLATMAAHGQLSAPRVYDEINRLLRTARYAAWVETHQSDIDTGLCSPSVTAVNPFEDMDFESKSLFKMKMPDNSIVHDQNNWFFHLQYIAAIIGITAFVASYILLFILINPIVPAALTVLAGASYVSFGFFNSKPERSLIPDEISPGLCV